ncbi:hypothetical protein [Buchnera aphidicola]|uniref:hypothetical protein n=1 Tax=Buchnera aphidicola TaxID=9 RepID=UPI003BEEE6BE
MRCTGCKRIDMIMNKNKKFWLLEIYTIPEITDQNLVLIAVKKTGIKFYNLVLKILHMNKLHITL